MAKRWIRDLWANRTEKKALSSEVRTMLLKAYEPLQRASDSRPPANPQHVAESRETLAGHPRDDVVLRD